MDGGALDEMQIAKLAKEAPLTKRLEELEATLAGDVNVKNVNS